MRKLCRRIRVKSPSMGKLDHADLALLSALADDPRATVVALAERLSLSRNTVQARMTKLEKAGVFLSYERTIAAHTIGYPLQAAISVMLRQKELPEIAPQLVEIPEIIQAYGLSGQVDLLVHVACRDARHLFEVDARILAIPGVERTETSLVMGEVIPYRLRPLMDLARQAR